MNPHFGCNCTKYLPTLKKCRTLIDQYLAREDLIENKWLTTQELFIYLGRPVDILLEKIKSGEIQAKKSKDKNKNIKLMFLAKVPCQYDDCFLENTEGQCLYFEAHDGPQISHITQKANIEMKHPNFSALPVESVVEDFEGQVRTFLERSLL